MLHTQLQAGSGLAGSAGQAVGVAASLVLVLMLLALGGFAYKSLRGDGIEWPDDQPEDPEEGGVQRAGDDDEWDYY